MNIMEISALQNPVQMRMEVLRLAKERNSTEDDIWLLIDGFRKTQQEGERPRFPTSIKDSIKTILPNKNKFKFTDSPIEDVLKWELQARNIKFETRKSIGQYRVDFFFPEANLIVEANGAEYHSTKEQRERDFKRQQTLMKKGYMVLRFTGSEIYKDPIHCVNHIMRISGIETKRTL